MSPPLSSGASWWRRRSTRSKRYSIGTYWSIGFIALVELNFAIAPRIPWLSRV